MCPADRMVRNKSLHKEFNPSCSIPPRPSLARSYAMTVPSCSARGSGRSASAEAAVATSERRHRRSPRCGTRAQRRLQRGARVQRQKAVWRTAGSSNRAAVARLPAAPGARWRQPEGSRRRCRGQRAPNRGGRRQRRLSRDGGSQQQPGQSTHEQRSPGRGGSNRQRRKRGGGSP